MILYVENRIFHSHTSMCIVFVCILCIHSIVRNEFNAVWDDSGGDDGGELVSVFCHRYCRFFAAAGALCSGLFRVLVQKCFVNKVLGWLRCAETDKVVAGGVLCIRSGTTASQRGEEERNCVNWSFVIMKLCSSNNVFRTHNTNVFHLISVVA